MRSITKENLVHRPVMILAAIVFFLGVATAGSAPRPVGNWGATLTSGTVSLHLVLHITQIKGHGLGGTLDSPDQGTTGIKLTAIRYHAPELQFDVGSISATFSGKVKGNTIVGNWKQIGQTFPLTFTRMKK